LKTEEKGTFALSCFAKQGIKNYRINLDCIIERLQKDLSRVWWIHFENGKSCFAQAKGLISQKSKVIQWIEIQDF
jgi:hypothetical protein